MDPVNSKALKGKFKDRADKDIDNDGDVDSSDEYLHKRRKAVSKAIGKIKEEVGLDEAATKYVIKHKKTKQVLNTHDDYATAKDEHEGLGADKKNYGVYKQTKKDAALRNRNTYREEVDLDEAANKLIARYMNKSGRNVLYVEIYEKPNGNYIYTIKNQRGINISASAIDLRSSHADAKKNVDRVTMYYDQDGDVGALRFLNGLLPGWKKASMDEVSTEKLRDYASAALQDKNRAKADKRWKYASKAMKAIGDREAKAAHALKYNKKD